MQLKDKFQATTKRSQQLQVLTVLPQSWTRKQIQSEFGVKEAGCSHTEKRLILSNRKEVYCAFKNAQPDKKICFSKFVELRPKHCVLAGASGTHTVCVCVIHQNMKLTFSGAR